MATELKSELVEACGWHTIGVEADYRKCQQCVKRYKKYQIIYADPPWNSNSQFGRDKKRGNEQHYPLMTLEDIKNLPVEGITDKNCILFLWVVDTQLFEAKEVLTAYENPTKSKEIG